MHRSERDRLPNRIFLPVTLALALALALAPVAASAEEDEQLPVRVTGDELVPGWSFEFTLYAWAKSIEGSSGGNDLDLKFKDDILDMLDAAAMASLYAGYGRWLAFGSWEYSKLGVSEDDVDGSIDVPIGEGPLAPTIPVPITGDIEVSAPQHVYEIGGGYKVVASENFDLILHGGTRYFDHEMTVRLDSLTASLPPFGATAIPRQKFSEGDTWWQPFLGIRFATRFADNWRLRGRADYGYSGSGDNNEMALLELVLDWRFKHWGAVELGYRQAEIDYDNGSSSHHYDWDMTERGPRLGFIFHF